MTTTTTNKPKAKMTPALHRATEIICLTGLMLLALLANCWGPTLPPPPTPIVNPAMAATAIVSIAAYGFWKMRK